MTEERVERRSLTTSMAGSSLPVPRRGIIQPRRLGLVIPRPLIPSANGLKRSAKLLETTGRKPS